MVNLATLEWIRRRDNDDAKLEELHLRDNLEAFVDGLIRTEVFPYPDGQLDMVVAPEKMVPLQQVKLKPEAYEELTILYRRGAGITLNQGSGMFS